MGRGSQNGGSTVAGPSASYWRRDPDDRHKSKKPDPELEEISREHDRLRAQQAIPRIVAVRALDPAGLISAKSVLAVAETDS